MDLSSPDFRDHERQKIHGYIELVVGVAICAVAGVVFFYGYFSYDGLLYVLIAFVATFFGLRLVYDAKVKLDEIKLAS